MRSRPLAVLQCCENRLRVARGHLYRRWLCTLWPVMVTMACSRATQPPAMKIELGVPPVVFPVTVSQDRRVLNDRNGAPFLIVGDSPWELTSQLSKQDTLVYLDDRKRRGFNTILIELMTHKFTSHTPPWMNAEGEVPFEDNHDFTTVRERFLEHVAWVIERAAERGMLVLLAPAYMGYGCADEGWCQVMLANGVSKLTRFGELVGRRFARFDNLIWVDGGDLTPSTTGHPSQLDLVNAVVDGIKLGDGGSHLHTAHWSRQISSSEGPAVPWLDIDATYSGRKQLTFLDSLDDWSRDAGVRPAFLIEGKYESEHNLKRSELRAQMYQPLLSGSMGFLFGNDPIWFFGRPGDGNPAWSFSSGEKVHWMEALGSPGAHYVGYARQLFDSINWPALQPDAQHRILKSRSTGAVPEHNVSLAATPDGKLAVAYLTARLDITVDLSRFASDVRPTWYDPTSGATIVETQRTNSGLHTFKADRQNSEGASDWVLLLQAL